MITEYVAKPNLNNNIGLKTFLLESDAIKYLEEVTGYEMDKVTKFKGTDLVFDTEIEGVVFTPGDMIRCEFATYDWELVGKLEEVA